LEWDDVRLQTVAISIDKLSFTARLHEMDCTSMLQYFQLTPHINEYKHMPWNFLYQHQFNFKEDGLFIQIGDYEREKVFRMEFNPNNVKNLKLVDDIIKRTKYPNITRIDWAVDYKERDFNLYEFRLGQARKTIEYRSRGGKLETKYLGSTKSDKFIRIYNKALERHVKKMRIESDNEEEIDLKEKWWRVEAVIKDFQIYIEEEVEGEIEELKEPVLVKVEQWHYEEGKKDENNPRQVANLKDLVRVHDGWKEELRYAMPKKVKKKIGYDYVMQNPFNDLMIYEKNEDTDCLKQAEKAMLFYLQHNPDEWQKMTRAKRNKYEKMKYAFEWMPIIQQPAEIFEKEKSRLLQEIVTFLKPALDNSSYLIGYQSNLHYSMYMDKNK
jgi:hypothetical protein